MIRDLRGTDLFEAVRADYCRMRSPGSGEVTDASEMNISPDGATAVFTGTTVNELEGIPATKVISIELSTGVMRPLTIGPGSDRLPKYSPDGKDIAFLSDRSRPGDFQLYLLHVGSGDVTAVPHPEGWVEYFHWSPSGQRILLGVAGHGADMAGPQGAITSKQRASDPLPTWLPSLDVGDESYKWRRVWIFDRSSGQIDPCGALDLNMWEANWCGEESFVAITSKGPSESQWYEPELTIVDLRRGAGAVLLAPTDQLGWPSSSPSGETVAVVSAVCSDRQLVAGELILIEVATRAATRIDTGQVDVTYTGWCSDEILLIAGQRRQESVIAKYDRRQNELTIIWQSQELASSSRLMSICGFGVAGDCGFIAEGFRSAPTVYVIRGGTPTAVRSLDVGTADVTACISAIETISWEAPDGLLIQGWLIKPKGPPPYSVVMFIHGGPVFQWSPGWLGRPSRLPILLLASRGYAVFMPNPRGSTGRGIEFARRVVGDIGGADTYDYLSGLDHLSDCGTIDPDRIGVTGGSYGGYMTCWLVTQDQRFAAAVPFLPSTNKVSQHLVSNIPYFVRTFLGDSYTNPHGKYFTRSPIMYASKVSTPTLTICGALDRCTPPEEGVQFHNALRENGLTSALAIYPEEGHGVRSLPAAFDFAARMVGWFEQHMPPSPSRNQDAA